jgi:hypothetical protein
LEALRFRTITNEKEKALMPVLDAKALEIDPKGAAFLKSVLRPLPSSETPPKETPRTSRVRFRMAKRSQMLIAGTM